MQRICLRPAARAGLIAALAALATPAGTQVPAPLPRPLPAIPVDARVEADLFAMPAIATATRAAVAAASAGDLAAAAEMLDGLVAEHPGLGGLRATRAALAMLADEPEAALEELEAAAGLGVTDLAALAADPLFAPLAADPALGERLAALAARPASPSPAPPPAPVAAGTAQVSAGNTAWNPASERLEPRFAFPPAPAAPVLPARPKRAALDILREHARRGRAAGNHGDLYDNRDRGHSSLAPEAHPQLTFVTYAPAARAADLDYGLNDRLLFDRPTFGNSSTAVTAGPLWRSLPRLALTQGDGTGPLRLWQNASRNHLYIHPAHRDFSEAGDLFPANTPYVLVSRGSSGSDAPFLEAVALVLAAFRPDTKARLVEEGLIVPTVQMVFRRSLQAVRSREAYFSSAAHSAAFDGFAINAARMVSLANAIEPGAIPPQVRLRMLEEELGVEGVDYFGEGLSEQLFDTPAAVARIWRSKAGRRTMLVSAEDTRDPNGRPLAFHWRLLQGDPAKVEITPLDGGRRSRVTLDWHEPFEISEANPVTTSRVDIGVFANNGVHDSAPAMLSVWFPPGETRSYELDRGVPRIAAIDHADPKTAKAYLDPMLVARADWRDVFTYARDGTSLGWTRHRAGRAPEDFTAGGARVLTRDAEGRPARTEPVVHVLRRAADGGLLVEELSPGAGVDYGEGSPGPSREDTLRP